MLSIANYFFFDIDEWVYQHRTRLRHIETNLKWVMSRESVNTEETDLLEKNVMEIRKILDNIRPSNPPGANWRARFENVFEMVLKGVLEVKNMQMHKEGI